MPPLKMVSKLHNSKPWMSLPLGNRLSSYCKWQSGLCFTTLYQQCRLNSLPLESFPGGCLNSDTTYYLGVPSIFYVCKQSWSLLWQPSQRGARSHQSFFFPLWKKSKNMFYLTAGAPSQKCPPFPSINNLDLNMKWFCHKIHWIKLARHAANAYREWTTQHIRSLYFFQKI